MNIKTTLQRKTVVFMATAESKDNAFGQTMAVNK